MWNTFFVLLFCFKQMVMVIIIFITQASAAIVEATIATNAGFLHKKTKGNKNTNIRNKNIYNFVILFILFTFLIIRNRVNYKTHTPTIQNKIKGHKKCRVNRVWILFFYSKYTVHITKWKSIPPQTLSPFPCYSASWSL